MNIKYKHIFFDLDHTLWDFELNARETLLELYEVYEVNKFHKGTAQDFVSAYEKINYALWQEYEHKRITKEHLRTERFVLAFEEIGINKKYLPDNIWEDYLERCPKKTNLIKDARNVCDYLYPKYVLHLITNGFEKTQNTKVKYSKLDSFFDTLTTSECIGVAKPHPGIYKEALSKANARPEECLMIGDNLINDVLGAIDIGMDAIWYNPGQILSEKPVKEIKELIELRDML